MAIRRNSWMADNEPGLFLPSLLLNALTSSCPRPIGARWTSPHWGTSLNFWSPSWFQAGIPFQLPSVILSCPGPLPSPVASSCSKAFVPSLFPHGQVVSSSLTISSSSAKSMFCFPCDCAQSSALHSQKAYEMLNKLTYLLPTPPGPRAHPESHLCLSALQ